MKSWNFLGFLLLSLGFGACSSDDEPNIDNEFTGRVLIYELISDSDYDVSGTIIFKELIDSTLRVEIEIVPTGESILHPAHLHYDSYRKDAEMAAMLNPVDGETGKSLTDISELADGTTFNYDVLKEFDGHVKIHGDDGPNKDVILAYGNIGKNNTYSSFNSNTAALATCK